MHSTISLVLITVLCSFCTLSASTLDSSTCQLKNNCDLNEKLIAKDSSVGDKLEKKITSIFEDKVNYSLKLSYHRSDEIEDDEERRIVGYTSVANLTEFKKLTDKETEEKYEIQEKEYMRAISDRFMVFSRPFDASISPTASSTCRRHTRAFLEGLQNFDLWAMKMHDSTGKLTSGILNGNINQYGDFDQCLGVKSSDAESDSVQGQYCLAYAQPVWSHKSKKLKEFFELVQSHSPFRNEFNDPGHRVPRYNIINWGICVPSSCKPQDVEYAVKEFLTNMTISTGVSFKVRVEPQHCQIKQNLPWDQGTKLAVQFFLCMISIVILSTVYELRTDEGKQNQWLTAFSLHKNGKSLFSTRASSDDIEAVHGIRFLNAIMLLLSHKSMAVFFNAFNNRTEMAESLGKPWTVIGRAASLYTDPFLMFSGMLTAYSLFGRLLKGQPARLKNEYIGRLMRIVPPLAALIVFCTFILPMWGSGPQWNLVVGHHSNICKKNWWRNLLFIHNYFGFGEMCLTHTHHLGIDTELFVVAPLMIFSIWKWPRGGVIGLISLGVIGTAARYYTTVVNELSNYVYFGTTIQRLFRTADYMYSFPPHRSTVYIMGIFLGYGLRKLKGINLTSTQLSVGWAAAIFCFLASLLGPAPMGDVSYVYNSTHAAIYAAFAPIAWCFFFAWIVFVSHMGYKNRLTNFFSWKGFQVATKLSYAIYLTQFPVFFFNVGRKRHILHYYNFVFQMLDTNELISIFIASTLLTLFFDIPFQNLKKLIFNRTPKSSQKSDLACQKQVCDQSIINNNEISTSDSLKLQSIQSKVHVE